ncbi:MAG: 4Fe-4S binding protein [Coriobacteriaceae bacterium]|nr:4Fe-4S binding protein [Coriobacteriaceae bacterium]
MCPTGASHINEEDGTVQIDRDQCIGCGACLTACPYGCRYIDVDTSVAEKCDLCASITSEGGLPQCVSQCGGMARWYGDLDEGIESFKGPRGETLGDFVEAYTDDDIYRLDDTGNDPQGVYILRHMAWQGGDVSMQ